MAKSYLVRNGQCLTECIDPIYKDNQSDEIAQSEDLLIINVGGMPFKVLKSNFSTLPRTRLSRLVRAVSSQEILALCDGYTPGPLPEFYFNRNWTSFNSILDFYRMGTLHLTVDTCAMVFKDDLAFWGIDELYLDPCCALKYYPEIEACFKEFKGDQMARQRDEDRKKYENFGDSHIGRIRGTLWRITEYPETSLAAQVAGFSSLGVVIISTLTFILQTFPEFQEDDIGAKENPSVVFALKIIDDLSISFFTLEYLIRFACAPRKWIFVKDPMNLVDLFAIIPFYLTLVLDSMEDMQIIGKAGKLVRLVRVLRIMRIFKLVRHFAGLQSLIYTLNQAYKELGLLMLLVGVAVLTFASLVYYAEKDTLDEDGWTFLDSFWWGIMTLTTVGYDHKSPRTFMGKVIGGLCALVGIFILTLPIPIVVNSFASYYKNRLWRNEVSHRRAEKLEEQERKIKQAEALLGLKRCTKHTPLEQDGLLT
ncbi:hypothetical protein TCAL_11941 [Tigriopus californicus]|uniref:BTB domain-containing protein n=2 Tax=Tigriopus californicus TaxID=6832 RepID=A0A553P1G3_TIGCA|nr:hypothetical protein TCAL_11941 [Tigriopus californicus]|eukprot:TCALIF_11941-PA protein Name:"Similar to Shab Potassium voltage-gated channel protein Shab (Drosophila melanogaster)" AED:0.09 eAED:0.09 QI:0/0/0/1/1/1/2/0/478